MDFFNTTLGSTPASQQQKSKTIVRAEVRKLCHCRLEKNVESVQCGDLSENQSGRSLLTALINKAMQWYSTLRSRSIFIFFI